MLVRHHVMGIRIMDDYTVMGRFAGDHPDRTRCGDCVDEHPKDILQFGIGGGTTAKSRGDVPPRAWSSQPSRRFDDARRVPD